MNVFIARDYRAKPSEKFQSFVFYVNSICLVVAQLNLVEWFNEIAELRRTKKNSKEQNGKAQKKRERKIWEFIVARANNVVIEMD